MGTGVSTPPASSGEYETCKLYCVNGNCTRLMDGSNKVICKCDQGYYGQGCEFDYNATVAASAMGTVGIAGLTTAFIVIVICIIIWCCCKWKCGLRRQRFVTTEVAYYNSGNSFAGEPRGGPTFDAAQMNFANDLFSGNRRRNSDINVIYNPTEGDPGPPRPVTACSGPYEHELNPEDETIAEYITAIEPNGTQETVFLLNFDGTDGLHTPAVTSLNESQPPGYVVVTPTVDSYP